MSDDAQKEGKSDKLGIGRLPSKVDSTSAKKLKTDVRRAFVFEHRLAGDTYEEIAAAAIDEFGLENLPKGWDKRRVWGDVEGVLLDFQEHMAINVEGVRQLELQRLDKLLTALWDAATGGALGAIDRVLKVMQRRAELLGLDKNRLTVDMETRGKVAFYLPEVGAEVPLPDVVGHARVGVCPVPGLTEGEVIDGEVVPVQEYEVETERKRQSMDGLTEAMENAVDVTSKAIIERLLENGANSKKNSV